MLLLMSIRQKLRDESPHLDMKKQDSLQRDQWRAMKDW